MIRICGRLAILAALLSPASALAQLTPPSFTAANMRQMLSAYPSGSAEKGKSVAAVVELWSTAGGSVYRCELKEAFGDEKLASRVCRIFLAMRIVPAKDSNGDRSIGRIQTLARFFVAGTKDARLVQEAQQGPDLELTVQKIAGGKRAIDVEVILEVDAAGKVHSCAPAARADKAYAAVACQNVGALALPPGRDASQAPVPYVSSVKVRFQAPGVSKGAS